MDAHMEKMLAIFAKALNQAPVGAQQEVVIGGIIFIAAGVTISTVCYFCWILHKKRRRRSEVQPEIQMSQLETGTGDDDEAANHSQPPNSPARQEPSSREAFSTIRGAPPPPAEIPSTSVIQVAPRSTSVPTQRRKGDTDGVVRESDSSSRPSTSDGPAKRSQEDEEAKEKKEN